MNIAIHPGSMGVASLALGLFDIERVNAGAWLTPVYVKDVAPDELEAARELLAEVGCTIEENIDTPEWAERDKAAFLAAARTTRQGR